MLHNLLLLLRRFALSIVFTLGHISYWYDRNVTYVVMASVRTAPASHCYIPWYE